METNTCKPQKYYLYYAHHCADAAVIPIWYEKDEEKLLEFIQHTDALPQNGFSFSPVDDINDLRDPNEFECVEQFMHWLETGEIDGYTLD